MARKLFSMLLFMFTAISFSIHAEAPSQITWTTNFQEGANLAKSTSKPMLVLFTGSDWCSWCIKLENEILNRPEFAEMVRNKFIFVKLDFPLNTKVPQDIAEKNKKLQVTYNVTGFPTVLILDPNQRVISSLGYKAGGPRAYAQHLLKIVEDQNLQLEQLQKTSFHSLTGTELKELYSLSKALNKPESQAILEEGLKSDQSSFFSRTLT